MPKLQMSVDRNGNEIYSITVPKAIVTLKGWKKGDILKFREQNGNVCLVEMVEK